MQVQAPEFALIQDLNVEVTENINENKEIIESINKIFSAAKAVDRLRIIKETSVLTESQTIELKNLIVQQNKDIRQAITQISGITDENKKIP
jgi:hypothetical protein